MLESPARGNVQLTGGNYRSHDILARVAGLLFRRNELVIVVRLQWSARLSLWLRGVRWGVEGWGGVEEGGE